MEKGWQLVFLYWLSPPKCPHKKDSYPLPRIGEVLESLMGAGHFSYLDLKSGFWQIKMEEMSKQYTAFTVGNLGFQMRSDVFWALQCPSYFSLNYAELYGWVKPHLLFDLPDNLIVFLQTAEEHLHQLHVVFDRLWEYNLKLKPSKCSLFKEEINYLTHQVSKWGICPSDTNLKAITECAAPQTYTEIRAFLGLVGHYRQFIKRLCTNCPTTKWTLGWGGSQ